MRWDESTSRCRTPGRQEDRERHAAEQPPELPALLDDQVVDRDRLVNALRRLPDGQRAVIVLRYWHQLSESDLVPIRKGSSHEQ